MQSRIFNRTRKTVFHSDQDKTFSLRDYLTPLDYRISRCESLKILCHRVTPDRRQSKTTLTIDERGSKTGRNGVFDCHLSPVGRQITIKNSVSNYSDLRSTIILTFSNIAYPV